MYIKSNDSINYLNKLHNLLIYYVTKIIHKWSFGSWLCLWNL